MSFVRATLTAENLPQFFGLKPKTGVKMHSLDTRSGQAMASLCDFKYRIANFSCCKNRFQNSQHRERDQIYRVILPKKFMERFNKGLEEDNNGLEEDNNGREEDNNGREDKVEYQPTSLLLPSIERLNKDTTEQNKELKVQSQNWSEFFGLKTKTGVTTRMFGSNTTWGKITALFCLDSTNRVKRMVVNEFNKQYREGATPLSEDSLKGKLTPATVINLLKTES